MVLWNAYDIFLTLMLSNLNHPKITVKESHRGPVVVAHTTWEAEIRRILLKKPA
jgi:hypothetical protein